MQAAKEPVRGMQGMPTNAAEVAPGKGCFAQAYYGLRQRKLLRNDCVGSGLVKEIFSGICARKGCLSKAIDNRVPAEMVGKQNCHANGLVARRSVELGSAALLYSTQQAFQLGVVIHSVQT